MLSLSNLDSHTLWTQLQKPYIVWVINAILVALLILQLLNAVKFFHAPGSNLQTQLAVANRELPPQPKPDIAQMHLFGLATVEDAPETRLNLVLSSIYQSSIASASRVVISSNDESKTYVIGDVLPGSALLESILADRIIIRYNGQLESLLLPRQLLELNQEINL